MDPLAGLLIYGPLGVWAVVSTGAVIALYRGEGKLREIMLSGFGEGAVPLGRRRG